MLCYGSSSRLPHLEREEDNNHTGFSSETRQQESGMKYSNHRTMEKTNLESESSKNKSLKGEVEIQTSQ